METTKLLILPPSKNQPMNERVMRIFIENGSELFGIKSIQFPTTNPQFQTNDISITFNNCAFEIITEAPHKGE